MFTPEIWMRWKLHFNIKYDIYILELADMKKNYRTLGKISLDSKKLNILDGEYFISWKLDGKLNLKN